MGGEGQGLSLKASALVQKSLSFGLSYLHERDNVWARDAAGPFILFGLGPKAYLISEVYYQKKSAVERYDPSTPDHSALISSSRFGYDFFKGFQIFEIFESAESLSGDYTPRQRVLGAGFQRIPRPHYEFYGKLERKLDLAFARDFGYQALLVSHYWF